MFQRLIEYLSQNVSVIFLPLILFYHTCVTDVFFNASCENHTQLEWLADSVLAPYQYVMMGRTVVFNEDGTWYFKSRFNYSNHFWEKNIPSLLAAPVSLAIGGTLKALACFSPEVREKYKKLKGPQPILLKNDTYRKLGLFDGTPISEEPFLSQNLPRRPGDEKLLSAETEALREIGAALSAAGILWWVDCGTCLGAYRHGGAIPWDFDIDIAMLEPDFQNVDSVLRSLDPEKYIVIDLSGRDNPMTLHKIMLRADPKRELDLYYFRIDPIARTLNFILSQENHIFLAKSWKIREQPFKTPTRFEHVFPLKRAVFDGVDIFVPNDIVSYLSRVYGKNLNPAKKYDPLTGNYEKDLSHPYWERPFAH